MKSYTFFPYSWHIDDKQTEVTVIRVYGLNTKNENVCVEIQDFTPYIYIELPDDYEWDEIRARVVTEIIHNTLVDKRTGRDFRPLETAFRMKKRLYYASFDNKKDKKGNKVRKKFPYLFMKFSHASEINFLRTKLRYGIYIPGIPGKTSLKVHEANATPILKLCCCRDIPTAGWINFSGTRRKGEDKTTLCKHEFVVPWRNLEKNEEIQTVPKPLIMSMDIEVNSSNVNAMPNPEKAKDVIFQISCVLGRHGDPESGFEKYILSLGNPKQLTAGKDVIILTFPNEASLLEGYAKFIQEKNPNVITGYNILGFDIHYMIERAKFQGCMYDFDQQSFVKNQHAKEKPIKWSSSAYGTQEFLFLEAEGRLFIDLLPLVKRDYKMDNYKLKTISEFFVGESKDPLTPKGIFQCYREGIKKTPEGNYTKKGCKLLGYCARYCVQDSVLVMKLLEKLQTWIGLTEMAKVCRVPVFSLYTQGQQVKVFSQVYYKCLVNNYVVEQDAYHVNPDDHYMGAHVFDPVPGVYDRVVPLDFSSLYPSIIIAYNMCWSTFVQDESIRDSMCNVIEWEDHQLCEHDTKIHKTKPKFTICEKRRFRFLKEPVGVLPDMLQNLLAARKNTKKLMKEEKKRLEANRGNMTEQEITELETKITVLDKRQLSYKVSCNSAYGILGVRKGFLPLMPAAMSVTARGRELIEFSAKKAQEDFRAKLVYGDSVTADTPLLVRYPDGMIDVKQIDDLGKEWESYDQLKAGQSNRKEKQQSKVELEVWTNGKWSKVLRVIRHKTNKRMFRVNTHIGCIDVTEDHSLIDENLENVKPGEVRVGTKLLHSFPEEFNTSYIKEIGEAFVWGVFFAAGSCSQYGTKQGAKNSWSIDNQNLEYLNKVKTYLEQTNPTFEYKILDTMKSSDVYKLVPVGNISVLTKKYISIFYNKDKYKIVPQAILNGSLDVKKAFFEGYVVGYGQSDISCSVQHFSCEGKVGAQGLFYLCKSIGYKYCSICTREDRKDNYSISIEKDGYGKEPTAIKKIIELPPVKDNEFVYDIETTEGKFHCGVGEIVAKNTDSIYITFPHLKTAKEIWEYAEYVSLEISKHYPKPLFLDFEDVIYWRFLILTKKRYMSLACGKDGIVSDKISKKGVLLARRDNSRFVREVYADIIMKVFDKVEKEDVLYALIEHLTKLFSRQFPYKYFIVTKSVGDTGNLGTANKMSQILTDIVEGPKNKKALIGDYKVTMLENGKTEESKKKRKQQLHGKKTEDEKTFYLRQLPAQVQLAEKMKRRGQRVDVGTRLEYVITGDGSVRSVDKDKQYEKIESYDYFSEHSDVLKIDYMYYLKILATSMDQVLDVIFHTNKFTLQQYKLRLQKMKVLEAIKKNSRNKYILQE